MIAGTDNYPTGTADYSPYYGGTSDTATYGDNSFGVFYIVYDATVPEPEPCFVENQYEHQHAPKKICSTSRQPVQQRHLNRRILSGRTAQQHKEKRRMRMQRL